MQRFIVFFFGLLSACGAARAGEAASAPEPAIEDAVAYLAELEARLGDAESIAIEAALENESPRLPSAASLELTGERARWVLRGERDGRPLVVRVESREGSTTLQVEGGEGGTTPPMREHRAFVTEGLVRAGLYQTAAWVMGGQQLRDFMVAGGERWAPIDEARVGEPTEVDGVMTVAIHARTAAFGRGTGEVTLYVDAATRLPVARENVEVTSDGEVRSRERYRCFDVTP